MGLYDFMIGIFGYERVKVSSRKSSKRKKPANKAAKKPANSRRSARVAKVTSLPVVKESVQTGAATGQADPSMPVAATAK